MTSPVHLEAALEVWRYCKDSAQYLFGDAVGHTVADRILTALRAHPHGMKRKAISKTLSGNVTSADIEMALAYLKGNRLAHDVKVPTPGRPAEVWFARK